MKGYRKFLAFVLSNVFYLIGCLASDVKTEGSIFVSLATVFLMSNVGSKITNKGATNVEQT